MLRLSRRLLTTFLFGVFLGLLPGWVDADVLVGRVVGVSDGDTVTVLTEKRVQHKVRLYGIDAPESAQAFGQAAKRHLSDLVYDRVVSVEVKDRDRFGRSVGIVRVGAINANEAQVEAGMAWWYRAYAKGDRRLAKLEREAKEARRGLWQDREPTPPWEFRRERRRSNAAQ